jgi:hypothetical protein
LAAIARSFPGLLNRWIKAAKPKDVLMADTQQKPRIEDDPRVLEVYGNKVVVSTSFDHQARLLKRERRSRLDAVTQRTCLILPCSDAQKTRLRRKADGAEAGSVSDVVVADVVDLECSRGAAAQQHLRRGAALETAKPHKLIISCDLTQWVPDRDRIVTDA